jgi:hypothetical protein
MKMRLLQGSLCLLAGFALIQRAAADPILPFQTPIAAQLTNDFNAGGPDARTFERGLDTFHKRSKNLRGDTGILRGLNNLLSDVPGYAPLLNTAALDYQADFQNRRDEITGQLVPAPISANKTAARTALKRVNSSLSNAVIATTTSKRLQHLHAAAQRLASASNSVQRALRTRPGLSKMVARIGVLSFAAERGQIAGAGSFFNNEGSTVGEFSESGVLSVSAVDSGSYTRGIHLHLSGVDGGFPVVYPLDNRGHRAFYDVTDLRRKREYHFQADGALTNSVITNGFVSIDYIGTNSLFLSRTSSIPVSGYVLGRFEFIGVNTSAVNTDTNLSFVTVSGGEFQLNFDISTNSPVEVPD